MTGTVWDASAQGAIRRDSVVTRALNSQFVLLGEIHDDAEHHRLQAVILQAMVGGGRRPALVLEQFDLDQQGAIEAIVRGGDPLEDQLQSLSKLMRSNWDWPVYEPMIRIALRHKLPVVAANLSREALRQVGREGYAALGAGEEARLALQEVWTPARQTQLVRDISEGHCGKLSPHLGEVISRSQRARDAAIADTLLKFQDSGAIALLGRNHARKDLGVPLYLAARAPNSSVMALAFMEVAASTDPSTYAQGAIGRLFDYVWFTPRATRQVNPCEGMPTLTLPSAAK